MILVSIAEREQFRGLLAAKLHIFPHIRINPSEKSTSFLLFLSSSYQLQKVEYLKKKPRLA